MLKYLPLLWAGLGRRKLRLAFTFASVVVAFLLYGLLEAMRYSFAAGVDLAGADRLMTMHKVTITQPLPAAYGNRIRGVDGVTRVASMTWFGGVYQNDRNQLPVFPVDPEEYLTVYSEVVIDGEQRRAWLANRRGALVGRAFAEQFGWRVGDTIPMRSNIWRKQDGGDTWELQVEGIYDIREGRGDTRSVLMHYDYFNESRAFGRDYVGWYVVQVADPARAPEIARRIDTMFANSAFETRTSTEKAVAQQFANQVGNIGKIVMAVVSAVFFTMLLVTANAMAQSVRERTGELAVLKTLGYPSLTVMLLVLAEAVLVTVVGGAVGLGLAHGLASAIGPAIQAFLPVFEIPAASLALGVALMILLGLAAGALPASQALRLEIVAALRRA